MAAVERAGEDMPREGKHSGEERARGRATAQIQVRVRRAYEPPEPEDGQRVLVDRLWPRGLSKERAQLDTWLKEVAPSGELRRWYGHEPERWEEFVLRYRAELAMPERQALLGDLAKRAAEGPVTLITATHDAAHSGAEVVRQVLFEQLGHRAR